MEHVSSASSIESKVSSTSFSSERIKSQEDLNRINITNNMLYFAENSIMTEIDLYEKNKRIGEYKIVDVLGKGSSAKVYLCYSTREKKNVAIKVINKDNSIVNKTRILREIAISTLIKHPHIVNILEFMYDKNNFYLVFEHVEGEVLYEVITNTRLKGGGCIPKEKIRKYFRQMVSAIEYLHLNGIVHRDLKVENIIIDVNDNVQIIDFGLSNFYYNDKKLRTFCGSLYFAAPELLIGKEYIGPEIDIWSLGVVLYVMAYSLVPFDDSSITLLQNKIKSGCFTFPRFSDSDDEIEDLIRNMMLKESDSRFCMEDIKNSVWINEGYNKVLDNYYIQKPRYLVYNEEVATILENLFSFQFSNVKSEIRQYCKLCKVSRNTLELKNFSMKPIVSMYCLLLSRLTDNCNHVDISSTHMRWQTSPIISYLNSDLSDVRCIKKFLMFLNEIPPIEYMQSDSTMEKENEYPLVHKSYMKGLLNGVKVKNIQYSQLKKKLIDVFLHHSITYRAEETSFQCSYYANKKQTNFKVFIHFNIILREYILTFKNLNRKKELFYEVQKLILKKILE